MPPSSPPPPRHPPKKSTHTVTPHFYRLPPHQLLMWKCEPPHPLAPSPSSSYLVPFFGGACDGASRGVLEALAGLKDWLLPDHTRSLHQLRRLFVCMCHSFMWRSIFVIRCVSFIHSCVIHLCDVQYLSFVVMCHWFMCHSFMWYSLCGIQCVIYLCVIQYLSFVRCHSLCLIYYVAFIMWHLLCVIHDVVFTYVSFMM